MTARTSRPQAAAALLFLGAVLLVATDAPPWTVAIAMACALWRLLIATGRLAAPKPRRGLRFLFGAVTALLVGGVLLSFRTLNGLSAGTALLVLMGALKLLESRNRRDDAIVIGVALFLLLAAALADQSLGRVPLYLLFIWCGCAAMMLVAHPDTGLPLRAALSLSARALAMALPLAIACFLFFPRFAGQFWSLPRGGQASTGLSDEMAPGAIDKLVAEYEPAFRVTFNGPVPPPEQRYWRGPVLNDFDGYTWRRAFRMYKDTPVTPQGERYSYRVTLEPTHRNWVIALESVDASPRRNIFLTWDRLLYQQDPIDEPLTYEASSHLRTITQGELSTYGRRIETRLPEGRNPRALALARELRGGAANDLAYSRTVLRWFADHGLEYTLQPDPTSLDSVDSVLFDTRKGFCGHFASAYVTLMRAVGIPARVVTGYQGGELNPIGGFFVVRQSDAHAWAEVWLDGQGWTRIDPTAVVAPERLRRSLYDVISADVPVGVSLRRAAWIAQLAQLWDGANQWWRERVLEFDLREQLGFLRKLGIDSPDWRTLGWGFAGALLLWLVWVSSTLSRSLPRTRPDRIARAWLRATKKLERVAPARAASEGAMDYAARVAKQHPPVAANIVALATRYTKLRFGPDPANEDIAALERDVSRLAV